MTEFPQSVLAAAWMEQFDDLMWLTTGADKTREALSRAEVRVLVDAVMDAHPPQYDPARRNCLEVAELLRYRLITQWEWNGMGVVIDYEGLHCYNVALSHEGAKPVFLLVEPQTGQFVNKGDFLAGSKREKYACRNGYVIL